LSPEKTTIAHIEEGFEFLGWRIQRHQQRGSQRRYVYTYPSRKALAAVKAKVRAITGQTDGARRSSPEVLAEIPHPSGGSVADQWCWMAITSELVMGG
jgi:hypothetical protein